MNEEIAQLDGKIETLRKDVNTQLTGVRTDIKELTEVLRDLIRMDGEIKNISTLTERIGNEVDDHEKRLRGLEKNGADADVVVKLTDRVTVLEQSSAVNTVKIGSGERLYWLIGSGAVSLLVGVIVFLVTK